MIVAVVVVSAVPFDLSFFEPFSLFFVFVTAAVVVVVVVTVEVVAEATEPFNFRSAPTSAAETKAKNIKWSYKRRGGEHVVIRYARALPQVSLCHTYLVLPSFPSYPSFPFSLSNPKTSSY